MIDFSGRTIYMRRMDRADRDDLILFLRREGLLAPQIVEALAGEGCQIGVTRVRQILAEHGLSAEVGRPTGPGRRSAEATERRREATYLRSPAGGGLSFRMIAGKLGVSKSAVVGYFSTGKEKSTRD